MFWHSSKEKELQELRDYKKFAVDKIIRLQEKHKKDISRFDELHAEKHITDQKEIALLNDKIKFLEQRITDLIQYGKLYKD